MQGYVLEVKNICLLLIFVDSNFIMAVFGWMLLYPVFLITQKKNCSTPKNHHFSDPDAQKTMGQCHS